MRRIYIAFIFLFAFSVSVLAAEDAAQHRVSITISLLHLLNPELHLTGELRLARKIGVAAMLGAGTVSEEDIRYGIWEIGGQFRYYLIGSFTHGMMLGVDVGYVGVNREMENAMAYLIGARAGAFLGYKITMKIGFTAEAQIGPVYVRENADNSELQTLINLKLGWSF